MEEIHTFVRKFGEAAAHAKKAGFDGVEIHAIHEGTCWISLPWRSSISAPTHTAAVWRTGCALRWRSSRRSKRVCGADFPVGVRVQPQELCP